MTKFNISPPSGFPEWNPKEKKVEEKFVKVIREVFESYGFFPIETPLVEREENLLAKGGNPKEMYVLKRILDDPGDTSHSGNALRFDLTVPLALYVARHMHEITFPFRRYAIGPVFRGERAQKGRFRQFTQCDIDVIGNETLSIQNDALMPAIIIEIFKRLNIGDFVVRINNRKVLMGLFEFYGGKAEEIKDVLDQIDNLEKNPKGKKDDFVLKLLSFQNNLSEAKNSPARENKLFSEGILELEQVFSSLKSMGGEEYIQFDPTIARGLDYYTGTVFETNLKNADGTINTALGSICSGGRYDDLAEIFTGKSLPGVGISIGLTRLLSKLFEAGILEKEETRPADFLVCALNKNCIQESIKIGNEIRKKGFRVENYWEDKKLGKQIEYADKLGIPKCVIVGEDEMEKWKKRVLVIKDLATGEQKETEIEDLKK